MEIGQVILGVDVLLLAFNQGAVSGLPDDVDRILVRVV